MQHDTPMIDLKEFKDEGYLQEVNRQFFHPLGLAMMVIVDEDGIVEFGGIWDVRDDPEGIIFSEGELEIEKVLKIQEQFKEKGAVRLEEFGWVVQPHPGQFEDV